MNEKRFFFGALGALASLIIMDEIAPQYTRLLMVIYLLLVLYVHRNQFFSGISQVRSVLDAA